MCTKSGLENREEGRMNLPYIDGLGGAGLLSVVRRPATPYTAVLGSFVQVGSNVSVRSKREPVRK